jgi:hypothetical protein
LINCEFWTVKNAASRDEFIKFINKTYEERGEITFQWVIGSTRTKQQNNALHLYCRNLATALNDAGYDMKKTIKQEVDIPWSDDLVKKFLWRPIQKAITGKDSTAHIKKEQYNEIYQVLNRHLSDKFGVSVPFPQAEP